MVPYPLTTYNTDLDELFTVRNGECLLVTQGCHAVTVPPGSQVYFLNYLTGELLDDDRGIPSNDDPDWGWMKNDDDGNKLSLPVFD